MSKVDGGRIGGIAPLQVARYQTAKKKFLPHQVSAVLGRTLRSCRERLCLKKEKSFPAKFSKIPSSIRNGRHVISYQAPSVFGEIFTRPKKGGWGGGDGVTWKGFHCEDEGVNYVQFQHETGYNTKKIKKRISFLQLHQKQHPRQALTLFTVNVNIINVLGINKSNCYFHHHFKDTGLLTLIIQPLTTILKFIYSIYFVCFTITCRGDSHFQGHKIRYFLWQLSHAYYEGHTDIYLLMISLR